jgi:hypothetical protein
MKPMLEVPNDSVSHSKAESAENGIKHGVERYNCPLIHIIANLPADASGGSERSNTLGNHLSLLTEVRLEVKASLVFFAKVVRG